MSKTGWANAIGSIGQGLLVFGANREKLNYEKERDANLLELEREQARDLKEYQGKVLDQGEQRIKIEGELATASIAASGAATAASNQSVLESQANIASLQKADTRTQQDHEYTQKLLGNLPVKNADGEVIGYKYDQNLYDSMEAQRENERMSGSPVSANMQLINAQTKAMVEGQKNNPDDPKYNVTLPDGKSRPKNAAEFKSEAITNHYQSIASVYRDLPTEKALEGVDDQIQALQNRLAKGEVILSAEVKQDLQNQIDSLQVERQIILAGYGTGRGGLLGASNKGSGNTTDTGADAYLKSLGQQ